MINAWHLCWMLPLAAAFGAFLMAIIAGGDCDPSWYDNEQ